MGISLLAIGSTVAVEALFTEAVIANLFVRKFAQAIVVGALTKVGADLLGLNDQDTPSLNQRGLKINTETDDFNIPVIYGRMIVGCNVDLRDVSGGSNEYLHQILTWGEGEVESIEDIFLDDVSILDKDIYPQTIVTYPKEVRFTGSFNLIGVTLNGIKIVIDDNTFVAQSATNVDTSTLVASLISNIQGDAGYSGFGWTVAANGDEGLLFEGKLTTTTIDISELKLTYLKYSGLGSVASQQTDWVNSYTLTGSDDDGFPITSGVPITKVERGAKNGTYYLNSFTGTTTQAVDSVLDAALSYITSAHQGKGICYSYLRFKFDRDNLFSLPTITAEIKGMKVKVWDGASWSTEWSDNPAWCIRDYLTDSIYGQGIDEALIDDDSWYAAAQYCDGTYDTNELSRPEHTNIANTFRWAGWTNNSSRNDQVSAWDAALRSDVLPIDSTGTYLARFKVTLYDWQTGHYQSTPLRYRCAVGLNLSSTEDDPDTASFLINITQYDGDTGVGTLHYQVKELGSVVASGTQAVDRTDEGYSWMNRPEFKIESVSGTLKYYINDIEIHESTVTPNATYYPSGYIYDPSLSVQILEVQGSRTRFRLNGKVDTARAPYDNLKEMLSACRGMLVFSGGKYKLVLDKKETGTPTFTFDEDNITGGWDIALGGKNDTYNRAKVSFLNKSRGYEADTLVIDNSTVRADEDNGLVLEKEIPLPFTTDPYDAQILGTMILNQSRSNIACSFTAFIGATEVQVGDVVYLTHSTPGWTNKKFRVLSMEFLPDHNVSVSMIEYYDTNYDFTLSTVDESQAHPNSLVSKYKVLEPLNVTATIGRMKIESAVNLSWDAAPGGALIDHYEIRVIGTGAGDNDSDYRVTTKQTQYNFTALPLGDYEFTIEAVNPHGVHSPSVTAYIEIESQPVPNVTGLEIDLGGEDGEANGTSWSGKDCKIKWRASSTQYSYEMNNNEPNGASSGGPDYFIKDYQVDVYNGSDTLLRTEYVTDTWYIYTQEKNLEDAVKQSATEPYRDLQFHVWTRGYFGQRSAIAAKL